nr:hypothetical protein F26G5.11 - Caenorhabditis elegans [Caenorhabditis elegans]
MSVWEQVVYLSQTSGTLIALILHSILLNLIINHSPKDIGEYKYLMLFISIFEIIYAILDGLVQPVSKTKKGLLILILETSVLSSIVAGTLMIFTVTVTYCSFYGSSMAILTIHFAYRLWIISGTSEAMLKWFRWPKVLIWLLFPFMTGMIWFFVAYFTCYPRTIIHFWVILSEVYDCGLISLILCVYFGFKCWKTMSLIFSSSSTHYQKLQTQLFYALVAQTLIPVFLLHIPVLTMFTLSFLNLDIGALSEVVSITIALFPTLDPLPTMLIVCHYRNAITNYFRSRYKEFRKVKCGKCLRTNKHRHPTSSITL